MAKQGSHFDLGTPAMSAALPKWRQIMPQYHQPEQAMEDPRRLLPRPRREPSLSHLRLSELVSLAADKTALLARKEIELAKADAKADLRQEAVVAVGLGTGGVCAILTLAMFLLAVVFGLIEAGLPGWAASLAVAAAVLIVGSISAYAGWRKRVQEPMAATRRSLERGMEWARGLR